MMYFESILNILNKKKFKSLEDWIQYQIDTDFKSLTLKYKLYNDRVEDSIKMNINSNLKKYSLKQFIKYIVAYYLHGKINIRLYSFLIGTELTHFKLTGRMHTTILQEKEKEKELEFKKFEELKKNYARYILNFIKLTKKRILILKRKYISSKTFFLKYSNLNILKLLKNKKYFKKELFKKSFKKWHIILNDFLLKKIILSFMLNGNKYKSYKRIYNILKKIKVMFGINPLYLIHSFFNKIKSIIEVNIIRYKKKIIYKPKFISYKKQIANVFIKMKEILFDSEYDKLSNIKMTYEEKFIYILIFFSLKKNYLYLTDSEKLTTKLFFNKKHLLNIKLHKKKLIKNFKKKKKKKSSIRLSSDELKKKKIRLTYSKYLYIEKEKNRSSKFKKYFKKYNNIKYINYNYKLKYNTKKNTPTGIYKKNELKKKYFIINNNIDYFEKKKNNNSIKKIYNKNKKLKKKKDPLSIYISRSYNSNDYNTKILTRPNLKKTNLNLKTSNTIKLSPKIIPKRRLFKKKKYLKKKKKIFIKKFSWLNSNKKVKKTKLKKKKDIWLRYNNIYSNNKSILKNQLFIEKIITDNDYFSELKTRKIPVNKIIYKTNKFLGFKKKY